LEPVSENSAVGDDERLEPWIRYLETVDFEGWWERDSQ
jgi:hypothetical protein